MKGKIILPRRDFFRATGVVGTSILLPQQVMAALGKIKKPIKLGMIADLHQDVMHDGPARLKAFLDAAAPRQSARHNAMLFLLFF